MRRKEATSEQLQIMRENAGVMTVKQIASMIGVSYTLTYKWLNEYNIEHQLKQKSELTDNELMFIKENKDKLKLREMAQHLGISISKLFRNLSKVRESSIEYFNVNQRQNWII